MKKIYSLFLLLLAVSFAAKAVQPIDSDLPNAYGEQLKNSTFEGTWDKIVWGIFNANTAYEPKYWSGFADSPNTNALTSSARNNKQMSKQDEGRDGSPGSTSVKINVTPIYGVKANGALTTGRVSAGSISPTNEANHMYTQRGDDGHSQKFESKPDSITVWVKYTTPNPTTTSFKARLSAVLHGDINMKDPFTGDNAGDKNFIVGYAVEDIAPHATPTWERISVAYDYASYTHSTPKYMLVTLSTNKTPGEGTESDVLLIDDILMIYNPKFDTIAGSITSASGGNDNVKMNVSIEGTMSPYNLNGANNKKAKRNALTLELSDPTGSFTSPTNVVTSDSTDTGGIYNIAIPDFSGTSYRMRVKTTNYPMTSGYIYKLSVSSSNAARGIVGGQPTGYLVSNSYQVTATPSLGYRFVKWTKNDNKVSTNSNYTFTLDENMDVVAHFEPIPYTITYDNTKGISHSNPAEYTIESAAITLSALSLPAGYSAFEGWFNASNTKVETILTGNTGDLTLTAKWTTIPYTITYHNTDGSTHTNPATYNVETPVSLVVPTVNKIGYTFDGWYSDAGFTTLTTGFAAGTTGNKDFYAKWTPINYNITYNNIEGATHSNPATYNITQTPLTLQDASKTGYTFEGWFTESGFTNQVTAIAANSTGVKTFYAKWEIIPYTINYNLGADETNHSSNPAVYNITTPTITLAHPTKSCYTFKGWKDDSNNEVTQIIEGSTGNINLHPQWEFDIYTIKFVSSNTTWGTVSNEGVVNSVNCGDDISSTAAVTDATNYEFVGWFDEDDNLLSEDLTYIHTPDKSETITAVFEQTGYFRIAVSRNLQNAGSTTGGNSYLASEECTVTATANNGYQFVNWTQSGMEVSTETSYSFTVTANRNLVANFVKIPYTITYNNDVGISHSNPTTYDVETTTFSLSNLTRSGYTFDGWFDDSNNKVTQITKGTTGNLTLTAQWTLVSYNITYNNVDGATNNPNPATYTIVETPLTLHNASKAGYIFRGWFANADFTGDAITQFSAGSTGNKTFYAKWTLETYTITYHNVPTGIINGNRTSYNIENLITALSALVRDYYNFDGWYADADFGTPVSSITGVMGNIDIYAKWTPVSYPITYHVNGGDAITDGSYTVETEVTLPLTTKKGYAFEGWFENEDFTGTAVTEITIGSHGNKAFWAKWSLVTYSISYHAPENVYNPNGGKTSYTIESETITLKPLEQEFHTFDGWFTNEDFADSAVTEIPQGSTGNVTLYAKLSPYKYIISLETNNSVGGTVSGSGTYDHGSQATVTATANSGYKFIGWTENKEIVKNAQASYTFRVEKARTLVANFNPITSSSKDFAPEGITAYAKDRQIIVRFSNEVDPEVSIYLFDITGNLLYSQPCESQEMSFNVDYAGLYFVQVGSRTVKVVVR